MPRAAWSLVLGPMLGATLAACTNFEPASLVNPGTLRVLALQSNPAEVASNELATIRSLVVDLNPGLDAGTITYDWALCTERPTVGVEIAPDCYDADMADYLTPLPSLADGTTQFTMPSLKLSDFNLPDASGGLYVPVRLRVTSGNQTVSAFINVRWAAGFEPPNQNPTLTGIDYVVTGTNGELPDMGQMVDTQPIIDGTALDVPNGGKVRLRALDAPGSAETYTTFVGSPTSGMTQTVTEQIRFLWYVTAGKLSPDVTGAKAPDTMLDTTKYTDALSGDDDLVDIWLVAVEERGGTDFLHRQVHLR